ncbi:MAG: glycosyltransferase [Patescibacteria group bacterium]|nr:glycosyltransferase [Patescibacteria group bacterium]
MKINKLSIIIPVYNEVETLPIILGRIDQAKIRPDIEKEIIIVDDGSTDGTREILEKYKNKYRIILQEKNQGKGAALRAGFAVAGGDYLIVQDADLEYDPNDIQLLIDKAEETGSKIVFGSRTLGQAKEQTPGLFFYLGGHLLSWLANFLYGIKITDEPTCYKMFAREVLDKINLECTGFEFCPEFTAKAARIGYKIEEVPISYNTRTKKEGKKIKLFKDGWQAIWTLVKYRFNAISALKGFLKLYRWWLVLLVLFLLVRIVLFASLWSASPNGWEDFYNQAQASENAMAMTWHEECDWHPPLYYFFVSLVLFLFQTQWALYSIQIILAFLLLIIIYKIVRLFFSKNIAFVSAFLIGVEPYMAWHNWQVTSENLYIPFLLFGFYFVFKFLISSKAKYLYIAAPFFSLATLTRLNSLFLAPLIAIAVLFIFLLSGKLKYSQFKNLRLKQVLIFLIIFNVFYLAFIFPWQLRNKFVYGRFSVANVLYTNMYFYNVPTLQAAQKDISYNQAKKELIEKTNARIGSNVGGQGDCGLFTKEELNNQFDYFQSQASRYIKEDFFTYLKIHTVRATPFFFQSGYLNLFKAYTGEYNKPDITGSLMRGDLAAVFNYFKNLNLSVLLYLFGLALWGMASLSVFAALIYTYFKDKDKFSFFLVSALTVFYTAFLCSPFVLARYRLPVYIFFIAPLVYLFNKIFYYIKNGKTKKAS